MTWVRVDGRDRWSCDLCDQLVPTPRTRGPWCQLYSSPGRRCRPEVKQLLDQADAQGDGALVNALCSYGRRTWGEDLDW